MGDADRILLGAHCKNLPFLPPEKKDNHRNVVILKYFTGITITFLHLFTCVQTSVAFKDLSIEIIRLHM